MSSDLAKELKALLTKRLTYASGLTCHQQSPAGKTGAGGLFLLDFGLRFL